MPSSNPQMGVHSGTVRTRQEVSFSLKVAAIGLRSLFLVTLVAMVAHVSLPQSESIWTIYDTPGDAIRLILGFLVIVWIVYHLFMLPNDAQSYRDWAYLGTVLVPLTLAALFAVW